MAEDIYFLVRSRPQLPLEVTIANVYCFDPDALTKQFKSLQDSIDLAIEHYREIDAEFAV
ncbi:MAG: hypothetical protein KME10_11405 [Plectolyngbya sp. WJT66-NPBG17]|jgi:hypothetical protein|nr:hypothetical protein [Plectolyngbya sp. WJT66-NPBG17]